MQRALAASVAFSLVLAAPSGAAAQMAAVMRAPSGPVAVPGAAGVAVLPVSKAGVLSAPALAPGLNGVLPSVLPQASVPAAAASAAAAQAAALPAAAAALPAPAPFAAPAAAPAAPSRAAAVVQTLAQDPAVAELAKPDSSPAARTAALDRLFDSSKPSAETMCPACPFSGGGAPKRSGLQPVQDAPVTPESNPELFRPRSSRVGIGPVKFVWWTSFYNVMQWFNLKLARDPNRRVSWDKWPTPLGLLYLLSKIRFLRAGTLTDPYDYAANDTEKAGKEPEAAKRGYTADGKWVSDRENPQMGATGTRAGSNIPPQKVRPDPENMTPSSRDVGRLRWRLMNSETGKAILKPALILNDLAGGWIQFQFHGFGGNTRRDPVAQNPHRLPRTEGDKWPGNEALVDRTTKDPTRVTDNGRPTVINERTHAWIQGQIYGTNQAEQDALRTHEGGKMRLDRDGDLPEDPAKPGVDQTGFNNNFNPELSFLHWLFTVEHNAVADHYRAFHPDWDDETLFQMARKVNVAQMARIHTIQWTEDLLQHPTLQMGMHADWYGFLGPKLKNWMMRMSYRHPWFRKATKWLTDNDTIAGMPGSSWEHHDGPYQVPKQFRMVYRLHEMVLDEHEIIEPGTNRTLDRISLLNFVHEHTRPAVKKFGYDVLGYSFAKKSAGALALHNFPRALTQFENQQDKTLTDLAERDIFRERTDGTGTYNEFRRSLGEPPVKNFLELTGGDAALAAEIERTYEGDIEAVDAGIGILAEPKPAGFALGFTQFYQFVLNAPRRVKSNRHLTEQFTIKDYEPEGMAWVEHGGGMLAIMERHLKGKPHGAAVVAAMEGVTRAFAPWPDAETFPVRVLDAAAADSSRILSSNLKTLALGAVTAAAAVWTGAATLPTAALLAATLAVPAALYFKRLLAWRFMQKAWQGAYTDRRGTLFPTLFKGEKWANRSASWGRLAALAVMDGAGMLAWNLWAAHPVVAVLALAVSLSGLASWSANAAFRSDMAVLKVALQNRLREGFPVVTDPATVPGRTALEKRYWFLIPASAKEPVARFHTTVMALQEHGLGSYKAFMTAALSHLLFGPKTQSGLSIEERWDKGLLFSPFAIYLPNLVQAQGYSNTRIFAGVGNAKGLTPGDVDMEEFERMFRLYAPGRDYMTAYDFARMREGNRQRDADEGRGDPVSRFLGMMAAKRRAEQLLDLYADRVVEEDKRLVPAVTRDMLLRVYQGTAQEDIRRERAFDGVHPDLSRPVPLR